MEAEAFDFSSPTMQRKLLYQPDITENSAFCQQVSKCRLRTNKWQFGKPGVLAVLTPLQSGHENDHFLM